MSPLPPALVIAMPSPLLLGPTASALLRLGQAHDPDAWAVLVAHHGPAITRLAHRLIGDHALADDAVQETFLALRDGAQRFQPTASEPESHAVGWVMRVAWTTILLTARQRRRRSQREVPLSDDRDATPAREADRTDVATLIAATLERLPERHRLPLTLHYLVGLGYPELAATMRVTISAARVRVHRALTVMRSRMQPHLPELSLALLTTHLETLPQPILTPGAHDRLQELLRSPRQALDEHGPSTPHLAVVASLAGLAVMALVLHHALPTTGQRPGRPADPPLSVAPAAVPAVPDYDDLEITLDLSDCSVTDFCAWSSRILRIPVRYQPSPQAVAPNPITLAAAHTKMKYVIGLICTVTQLKYFHDPAGGYILTDHDSPVTVHLAPRDANIPVDPHAHFILQVEQVTGSQFMQMYFHAAGGTYRSPFDNQATGLVSFRASVIDPNRQERLLNALLNGDGGVGTYQLLMHRPVATAAYVGTLADTCALLSRASGLTIRLDDQSGPMPRIRLVAGRLALRTLVGRIAQAAHLTLSQSADGCVLYRPETSVYYDQNGMSAGTDGHPYADAHPRWWWYQTLAAGPPLIIEPRLGELLFAPHWVESPLRAVAADLQQRLGVPVALQVDEATADKPILLATDERDLSDVLRCLSAASDCDCSVAADGKSIVIASRVVHATNTSPAPQPVAPPSPGLHSVQSKDVPDVETPAPAIHTSGG